MAQRLANPYGGGRGTGRVDERARFENLVELLEELAEANDATPILVEGRRDVEALRKMGCRGEIIALHTGETLFAVVERVAASTKAVILLTDWDRKGTELLERFHSLLTTHGVRCDRSYRDRIPGMVRLSFKDVESLPGYVDRGLEKFMRIRLNEKRWGDDWPHVDDVKYP